MIKPTMSHAVNEAHLNVLLVKYYEKLEAQMQCRIDELNKSNTAFKCQINEAIDHLYGDAEDRGYNAMCALGAE